MKNKTALLSKLQSQAQRQAQLERVRIFPHQIANLLTLIAYYPWQFLLILSFVSAVFIELIW